MDDNDELLDKIILSLRSEPVPEIPEDFKLRRPVKSTRLLQYAAAASLVAISLLGYVVIHALAPKSDVPTANSNRGELLVVASESRVSSQSVDMAAPLAELEGELASIDAQIDELHKHAALLDVRQQADAMLVKYESYADTSDPAN